MSTTRSDDGRYDHIDMSKPCRCGHTLAVHAPAGDRCCMNEDEGDGIPCACAKFKPVRAKRPPASLVTVPASALCQCGHTSGDHAGRTGTGHCCECGRCQRFKRAKA